MIEPKVFYRKLDSLLSKINLVKSGADFLFTIVKELGKTFGNDLHIGKGRIYEKDTSGYVLISPISDLEKVDIETNLATNSKSVQLVINNKTYIFDSPGFGIGIKDNDKKEYAIPAAISIQNQDHEWIVIYELKNGWIREEIEFCLNTVRSVINYRLLAESIKNEYEQAYLIQKSLLPTSSPIIAGYQIAGNSRQAELVGGDIFDYYRFNDEEFGFCIGDASGHGLPAALLARDAIIGLRMGLENNMKMVYTLKKLNRVIFQSVYSTRFISLFYAEMELNGNLSYVNAGHPSPILINKDDEVTELESTGLVFGALPEIDLRRTYIKIRHGSVLVLFSDGIVERQNENGVEFDIKRLKEVITKNKNMDAEEILNTIFQTVYEFGNMKKWEDDATVVVIKRLE
jgi:sigma-B regulation protein RsbU (phosphoserine phosphatase)